MTVVNKTGLAKSFDVSLTAVDRWVVTGCPYISRGSKGKSWEFDIDEVAAWRAGKKHNAANQSNLDLAQERARLARAQAEKAELEVGRIRGELIDADVAEQLWSDRVMATRGRLLAMPTRLAANIVMIADDGPAAVEDIIRDVVHECLTELERDWRDGSASSDGRKSTGKGRRAVGATTDSDGDRVGRKKPVPKPRKRSRTRKVSGK